MNQKHEALKTKLQENETHAQVRAATRPTERSQHICFFQELSGVCLCVCVFGVSADQPGEEMAALGAEQLCDERVYPSQNAPNGSS